MTEKKATEAETCSKSWLQKICINYILTEKYITLTQTKYRKGYRGTKQSISKGSRKRTKRIICKEMFPIVFIKRRFILFSRIVRRYDEFFMRNHTVSLSQFKRCQRRYNTGRYRQPIKLHEIQQ